jgi:hypothetical protein
VGGAVTTRAMAGHSIPPLPQAGRPRTGYGSAGRLRFDDKPSIILIKGASIIVITLSAREHPATRATEHSEPQGFPEKETSPRCLSRYGFGWAFRSRSSRFSLAAYRNSFPLSAAIAKSCVNPYCLS